MNLDTLVTELADARCEHHRRVIDATSLMLADALSPAEFLGRVDEAGRQLMLTTLKATRERIPA